MTLAINLTDEDLTPGVFPPSVTSLELHNCCPVHLTCIPNSVTKLFIAPDSKVINPGIIPSSVKSLTLLGSSESKMMMMTGTIPQSVRRIKLIDYHLDTLIKGTLPDSLDKLIIERHGVLPDNLHELLPTRLTSFRISPGRDSILFPTTTTTTMTTTMFPCKLTKLVIDQFDDVLHPTFFPKSLLHLDMARFNLPLDEDVLPPGLTTLRMNDFKQPFDWHTHTSLVDLYLPRFDQELKPDTLPPNLITLNVRSALLIHDHAIPVSVKNLVCSYLAGYSIKVIPPNVTKLEFECIDLPIGFIPSSVADLSISITNKPNINSIPTNELKTQWWKVFTMFQPGTFIIINWGNGEHSNIICRILDTSIALILSSSHNGGLLKYR
ncbi:hypothetical protein SAMD00019534_124220 [Acytostelium subglobosum LB1]|uniref:hypothetical protein n=1 Tax=Acytostelium subglobosum LB1 TaxID=1410327 RepID=UPI000644B72E|nr:hypothetical protein SAMD00019534_124220 [Acytostelium subglobosum LB1]GAM29246.1 hypothetical protein SAMD00019534_124220 [Acytostelium subglobosum LB1]|eukprot:XP_012747820.1 hypothetical protein SAMD00019534_124220 [Acytostelium subglobosum LB1]